MKKKNAFISILVLIVVILGIIFTQVMKKATNKSGTRSGSKELNFDDGLQRDELELLTEDDYHKYEISFMTIENLNLDDVDSYYYSGMVSWPGRYKAKATREERERIYYYEHNAKEYVLELCKKDSDLTSLIYNYQINSYNKHDGLLGDFDYTKIEKVDWVGYSTTDGCMDITVSNDKEERTYRIKIDYYENSTHINVKLGEIKQAGYNKEIELDKVKFDKEHTEENFNYLCLSENAYKGGLEWDYEDIAITDNMYSKYPYFLDLFIHYSPLEYNKITLKDLDTNNQIATFEVDSVLECKKRTYKVKYILDDKMYLDDVEVNLLNEEETDATITSFNFPLIFYKNSNWIKYKDVINCSDEFYERNKELGSYFPDIEKIDINRFKFEKPYFEYLNNDDGKACPVTMYQLKDGKNYYYYYVALYNDIGQLMDYTHIRLPYDSSMTLEEVRDAFLADKELQKELGLEISE